MISKQFSYLRILDLLSEAFEFFFSLLVPLRYSQYYNDFLLFFTVFVPVKQNFLKSSLSFVSFTSTQHYAIWQ